MPEIIRDGYNGFFVDRDAGSIAEAIEKLKNLDLRIMSVNARASIEDGWTWKDKVKNYERMFFELAKQRGL